MAVGNIKGITIEIGADVTKLTTALSSVNRETKSTQSALSQINKALKFDTTSTDLLKSKQQLLTNQVQNSTEKLKTLKTALSQMDASGVDKTSDSYTALTREIALAETEVKKAKEELKDFGSVGAQQISAVGTKVQSAGQTMTKVGNTMTTAVTLPIVAGLGAAVNSAIDFETSWTGVTKTVDGSEDQMANIKQGLIDLSKETASSVDDINGVAEAAGQLGVKSDNILQFTEVMVRLGDSTNISASDAATAIAQLYNVMGSDINTVDRFGAALVELGNNAATDEASIMNMATRVAASGKQIGLTEQQVLGLATTLSSVGLEAEAGGSAISAVLTQIDKDVATNNENVKTWAATAGMSAEEFTRLWGTDVMSAIQAVIKGMGDTKDAGGNLNVLLDDLGISSLRQTDTMKRLSVASEQLAGNVDLANQAWDENTALTNESDKRYDTTAAKVTQLKNSFVEVGVQLGTILLPILQSVIEKVSSALEWFTNLDSNQQKMVLTIAAVVAAIGPLLSVIGNVLIVVGTIMTYAAPISAFLTGVVAPIAAVIAIVAGLVAIGVTLYQNWDTICAKATELKEFVAEKWNNLKEAVGETVENLKTDVSEKWNNIKTSVGETVENIKTNVSEKWNNIKTSVGETVENIKTNVSEKWTAIKDKVSETGENIKTNVSDKWTAIKDKVSETGNNIKESASTTWDNVKDHMSERLNNMQTAYNEHGGGLKGTVALAMQNVKDTYSDAFNAVNTVTGGRLGDALDTARSKLGDIKDSFSDKIWGAYDVVRDAIGWIKGLFDFSWSLPDIKLPHFSVSGSFSLNPPSVPSIGVDWYDKGGIFSSPSIIGVGEKRPEFVGALDDLRAIVREEAGTQTDGNTTGLLSTMVQMMQAQVNWQERFMSVCEEYFPQFNRSEIVLDSGTLVGEIAPSMDRELGRLYRRTR